MPVAGTYTQGELPLWDRWRPEICAKTSRPWRAAAPPDSAEGLRYPLFAKTQGTDFAESGPELSVQCAGKRSAGSPALPARALMHLSTRLMPARSQAHLHAASCFKLAKVSHGSNMSFLVFRHLRGMLLSEPSFSALLCFAVPGRSLWQGVRCPWQLPEAVSRVWGRLT